MRRFLRQRRTKNANRTGATPALRSWRAAILFLLALLLPLSACDGDAESGAAPTTAPDGPGSAGAMRYTSTDSFSLEGSPHSSRVKRSGGLVYIYSHEQELLGTEPELYMEYSRRIDVWDSASGALTALWSDSGGKRAAADFAPDENGALWLCENSFSNPSGIDFDYEHESRLYRLSACGTLEEAPLPLPSEGSIRQLEYADGRLYALHEIDGQAAVFALDTNGLSVTAELALDKPGSLVITGEGTLCLLDSEGGLYTLNFESGETVPAPEHGLSLHLPTGNVYSGDGDFSLYLDDGSNIYGYELESGSVTRLINRVGSGIGPGYILPLGGGRFLSGSGADFLVIQPDGELPEPVVTLTLATLSQRWASVAAQFNRDHEDIQIELLDYSGENGALRLNTDLIAGSIPDILDTNGLDMVSLVSKGLLEDLYPYLDGDPDISRTELLENILGAYELDGGLYELPLTFGARSWFGFSDIVGTEPLSFEKYSSLASGMDYPLGRELGMWNRELYLENAVTLLYGSLVTPDGCDFEGELFAELLRLAYAAPSIEDAAGYEEWNHLAALNSGRQLLLQEDLYGVFSVHRLRAVFGGYNFGAVGFPGSGASLSVYSDRLLGITSSCRDKASAWELVSRLLSPEYQGSICGENTGELPVSRAALLEKCRLEAQDYESLRAKGEMRTVWAFGETVVSEYMPAEDTELFIELLGGSAVVSSRDEGLLGIVADESGAFLAGDRAAGETAGLIQSRAKLYLAERAS